MAYKVAHREEVRARDREYKREIAGTCSRCTGRMGVGVPDGVCRACRRAIRDESWRAVQLMWEDGLSMLEIAATLGWSKKRLSVVMVRMRREGWNLPYRYAVAA